tara:strand:+ start:503 stop:1885 length:1383 start_codon:yes stop_codon:yes gene_type:complete
MAFVLNDRVKETTTTTGTGTINLAGAETGFESFVAGVGNSNTCYYCIAHQTANEFEVGLGTVTDASPDTLARTTIISSSNSDSAVDFSAGTKDVFCTLPASKAVAEDGSGNFKVDVGGRIDLDAGSNGETRLSVSGSNYGTLKHELSGSLNKFIISTMLNDGDMEFRGFGTAPNAPEITALTFDFSNKGRATFNEYVVVGETDDARLYFNASSGYSPRIQSATNDLTLYTNNSERLRLKNDGKLGLGTSTPATDGYSYAEDFVIMAGASTDDGVGITLNSSSRRYGVLAFGDSADTNAGELWYDHTLNSLNMRTSGTSRFLLDSSGNATFTGNVTAYGSVSDERLKENIKIIENPIEKIKDLKGVTFTYKKDGEKSTGLIAQDLEKVLPEAVYTSETIADEREGIEAEEHLAIRYGNTVGLLVEAIKEQQEQIETLNDYVKLQSASIMDMERRLNELESK